MCTTSDGSGNCQASIQLPSEWFETSSSTSQVKVEIRQLYTNNLPQSIGSVLLHRHLPATVSNTISFVLPAEPILPSETVRMSAYAHAGYAIATYSIKCSLSKYLVNPVFQVDDKKWLTEMSILNSTDVAIVGILKKSDSSTFEGAETEEIFALELVLDSESLAGDIETVNCSILYLSNVLNVQVLPGGQIPPTPARMFDYNTTSDQYVGEILVDQIKVVALYSYAEQTEIANTAVFSFKPITVPLYHYLVLPGELSVTLEVDCKSTSNAFSISSDCSSLVISGNETSGAEKDSITVTYRNISTFIYIRIWYPYSGGYLLATPELLHPIKGSEVRNGTGHCVQQWQTGQVQAFAEYSYHSNSPSHTVCIFPFIVDDLFISSGHAMIDSEGVVSPYNSGNVTVSVMSLEVTFMVEDLPQAVVSLGVTLLSNITLDVSSEMVQSESVIIVTSNLVQKFDSINSQVVVTASALLEDGYSLPLTTNDGLKLTSLDESILTVNDGEVQLLGAGEGDVLQAEWISPCTLNSLGEGKAVASITVPEPSDMVVKATMTKLTYSSNYASSAGIPTSTEVMVTLVYPNGEFRNSLSDKLLNMTLLSGNSVLLLEKESDNLVINVTEQNDMVFGSFELLFDYNNGQFSSKLIITVVGFQNLSLYATPYPVYAGSDALIITTLHKIYSSTRYQKASLHLYMVLTDNSTVSVTESPLTFFSTLSSIFSPSISGAMNIEGSFSSVPEIAILSITVTDAVVTVESINNVSIGMGTLSGISGHATAHLEVNVTFNDSIQYPDTLQELSSVFSIDSNTDAISIDSIGGITLLTNHYEAAVITVSAAASEATGSVAFFCNLSPDILDIDLGEKDGVPIESIESSSNFNVTLRINAGISVLTSVELSLFYDTSLLEIASVEKGNDWQGTVEYSFSNSLDLQIVLLNLDGFGASSDGLIEFANIKFTAVSEGLARIQGLILSLIDSSDQVLNEEQDTVVAGDVTLKITGSLGKRSIKESTSHVRVVRSDDCDRIGDADNNCVFNEADTEFLLTYLVEEAFNFSSPSGSDLLNSLTDAQLDVLDADNNLAINPSDAYYLFRVSQGLTYLFEEVSVSTVSYDTDCLLAFNVSLTSKEYIPPDSENIAVFLDFAITTDLSFMQQTLFASSIFQEGSIILSPKSLTHHGGIIQTENVGMGTYSVSMATNLTSSDIGISVIVVTSTSGSVSPGQIQNFFGSLDPPYKYKSLDIEFEALSNTIPIVSSNGYNPYTAIANVISSSDCLAVTFPQFVQSVYSVDVPENTTNKTLVAQVTLSSGNIQNLTLSITSGNNDNKFGIDTNGSIIVTDELDFEQIKVYKLVVTAYDAFLSESVTTNVTITITDINDNGPVISPIEPISLPINLPIGSLLTVVTATDADSLVNGQIVYYIESDELNLFTMNPVSGIITLNKTLVQSLNYSIVVVASDLGSPKLLSSIVINVIITSDMVPVINFINSSYMTVIPEDTSIDTSVLELTAFVNGSKETKDVLYTVVDATDIPFVLDSFSGIISVSSALDYETITLYTFQVIAEAVNDSDIVPGLVLITIAVSDVNDNSPIFAEKNYSITVPEDHPIDSVLNVTITATDADSGENAMLVYSIEDSDIDSIKINNVTGEIKLVYNLDYESTIKFSIVVTATDQGVPSRNSSVLVTFFITDVNDNSPNISIDPTNPSVNESSLVGHVVLSIIVDDADTESVNGNLNISLVNGSIPFVIGNNQSQLLVSSKLDYEKQQVYNITILAVDLTNLMLSSTISFTIIVTDANDNPPLFNESVISVYVNESTRDPYVVLYLESFVDDNDSGIFAEVEFSLLSDLYNDTFVVESTGEVVLSGPLDYEILNKYMLRVEVSNIIPGVDSDIANITILITDVNEFPPVFSQNVYIGNVTEEDNKLGVFILNVLATDGDGTANITYNTPSNIIAVSLDGAVSTAISFDRETQETYTIIITADDGQEPQLFVNTTVVLNILDVNDNAPIIVVDSANVSILEKTTINTTVLMLEYSDDDIGDNAIVDLSLVGDVDVWIIVNNGIVLIGALDASVKELYTIDVIATDRGSPSLNSSIQVTITILPELPVFDQMLYQVSIKENLPKNTFVISTTIVNTFAVLYSISNVTLEEYGNLFRMDSLSGNITTLEELDRESENIIYTLIVEAESIDAGLVGTATVVVSVQDENDNPPIIDEVTENVTLLETAQIGSLLVKINASDADIDDNAVIVYNITGGNGSDIFVIDNEGNITTSAGIPQGSDILTLLVTASNLSPFAYLNDSVEIFIVIEPVNDFVPTFIQDVYDAEVPENAAIGMPIIAVFAIDTDVGSAGEIVYAFDDPSDSFNVNKTTGEIVIASLLDFESVSSYTVTVIARDNGRPSLFDSATVKISIIDFNDNPPMFPEKQYNVMLAENTSINSTILSLTVTDKDSSINSVVHFDISEQIVFAIQQIGDNDILILLSETLDRETETEYNITLTAVNNGSNVTLTATTIVTIDVIDINDNAPMFNMTQFIGELELPVPINTTILSVFATDDDEGSNAVVVYSLSTTLNLFQIGKESGVISNTEVLANPANYTFDVIASDGINNAVASVSIEVRTATSTLLAANRAQDLVFSNDPGIQLIGNPITSQTNIMQNFGFIVGEDVSNQQTIMVELGQITNQTAVQQSLQSAVELNSFLISPEVYYDDPIIRVATQVKDSRNNTQVIATSVTITVVHNEFGNVSNSSIASETSGIAVINISLPSSWFIVDANLSVYEEIPSQQPEMFANISLISKPTFDISNDLYVYMELPLSPVFVGELFKITVLGRAGANTIGLYSLQINCSEAFEISDIRVVTSQWLLTTKTIQENRDVILVASSITDTVTSKEQLLATVIGRVTSSAAVDTLHEQAFHLIVHFLGTNGLVTVLPLPGTDSPLLGHALSRTGLNTKGSIYVAENSPQVMFLYAATADLVNTAILSTVNQSITLNVVAVLSSGEATSINNGALCSSVPENSQSMTVAPDCSMILLSDIHIQPSINAIVSVNYMNVSGSMSVNVWTPILPISLQAYDPILNAIPDWRIHAEEICVQQYQHSKLQAFADYTDSVTTVANISVINIVSSQLISSDTSSVSIQNSEVVGVAPGSAVVSVADKSNDLLITVSNSTVSILGLDIQILTDILLVTSTSVFDNKLATYIMNLTLLQDLSLEGTTGVIVTAAVFSDSSRMQLDISDGLTFTSLDTSIITVENDTVTAKGDGKGNYVQVQWNLNSVCSSTTLAIGVGAVIISTPIPTSVVATLSSLTISAFNSPANIIGLPFSSTIFAIQARYESGNSQVLTNDARTIYSIELPLMVVDNVITASEGTPFGEYILNITFTQFPTIHETINIEVVDVTDLRVSSYAHPIFDDPLRLPVKELNTIANTSRIQEALLEVVAVLSSGDTRDISVGNNPVTIHTNSDQGILVNTSNSSLGHVITVTNATTDGNINITAQLGNITSSAPLIMSVSSTPVDITSIEIEPFPQNTFSGISESTNQIVLTVNFTDDTKFERLFDSLELLGLVSFTATPSDAVVIDNVSGIATLIGNSDASITVSAIGNSLVKADLSFVCNLEPDIGDVDLGQSVGLPIPIQSVNDDFIVPIRVNAGSFMLDSMAISLSFDASALSTVTGSDWTSGYFASSLNDPTGTLRFGGILGNSSVATGPSLHIADITFKAISVGITEISGDIEILSHVSSSNISSNIDGIPASISSGAVSVEITSNSNIQKRFAKDIARNTVGKFKKQVACADDEVCDVCLSKREAGDVDGNCVFDVRDASYLLTYYIDQLSGNTLSTLPADRSIYLDADLSGVVSSNDILFMLRAAFGLYRFITSINISPVTDEQCELMINATAFDMSNAPAQPSNTAILIDLSHSDPRFQNLFDSTNFTIGTLLTNNKGPNSYGGIILAEHSGGGTYGVVATTAINLTEIGVSIVQVTFDELGNTSEFRLAYMVGHDELLYSAVNTTLSIFERVVQIFTLNSYSALESFDSVVTTSDCIDFMRMTEFIQESYNVSIYENISLKMVVLKILATVGHPDAHITYSIDNASYIPFAINPLSGEISVSGGLDYEKATSYQFDVIAVENRTLTNDTTVVSIEILNQNDLAPVIIALPDVIVPANVTVGTEILIIEAYDPDMLDSIVYTIDTIDNITDALQIEPSTGSVTVQKSLLLLGNTDVMLDITASDGIFNTSGSLTISVYLPSFSASLYIAVVAEDSDVNSTVVETDILNTSNDNFTYLLCPQESQFTVSSNGSVLIYEDLDFEMDIEYNLTLIAISEYFYLSADIYVEITDVNDNSPQFSVPQYEIHLLASTPIGTLTTLISADDADSGVNAVIEYSLEDSSDAQFFSINSTTAAIVITTSLLNAPSSLNLTASASDSVFATTAIVIISLEVANTLFPAIPIISISNNAVLIGQTETLINNNETIISQVAQTLTGSETVFQVDIGLSQETTISVPAERQMPTYIEAYLLHPTTTIYSHHNTLKFVAQVRDENYFTSVEQVNVIITLVHPTLASINGTCVPDAQYGICTSEVTIPSSWFSNANVSWLYNIEQQSTTIGGIINLKESVKLESVPINSIVVQIPEGFYLPEEVASVSVYGRTMHGLIGASVVFNFDSALKVMGIEYDESVWTVSTVSTATSYGVVLITTTVKETISTDSDIKLFDLVMQLPSDIVTDQVYHITATVDSLSDIIEGIVIVNSSTSTSGPALFFNCSSRTYDEAGYLNVFADAIASLLTYTDQSVLLNTAVFSDTTLTQKVEFFVGYVSGKVEKYDDLVDQCESSDISVATVTADCSGVQISSAERNSSDRLIVMFTVYDITGLLPLRVYYPSSLALTLMDNTLERIDYSLLSGCSLQYQSTTVSVYSDFVTPTDMITNVVITPNALSSNDTGVVIVGPLNSVSGMSPGSAMICMTTQLFAECVDVTVTDDPVHVASVDIAIIESIELIHPTTDILPNIHYNFTVTPQVGIQLEATVLVSIQYTDMYTERPPFNLVIFKSYDINNDVFIVTEGGMISPRDEGVAVLEVQWFSPNSCLVVTKNVTISVSIPSPIITGIVVIPNLDMSHLLTTSSDFSASLGIDTNYAITISVEYNNGLIDNVSPNVTADDKLNINDGIIEASGTGTGLSQVLVSVPLYNFSATVSFIIVTTISMDIIARPYPSYPGSSDTSVTSLATIEDSSVWQMAQISLVVMLTDSTLLYAEEHIPGPLFQVSVPDNADVVATINGHNILIVTSNASEVVTINLSSQQFPAVSSLSMLLLDSPVAVSEIIVGSLPSDTLQGTINSDAYQLNVTLIFEDNTMYPNLYSMTNDLNEVVTIESFSSAVTSTLDGYLQPLLNSPNMVTITVNTSNAIGVLEFYVNLQPKIGDVDIGKEIGAPLSSAIVSDTFTVPIYVNTGSETLGSIELIIAVDASIINIIDIELGSDWSNGIYYIEAITTEGQGKLTAVFPESGPSGIRAHILSINLQAISPVIDTVITTHIVKITSRSIENTLATNTSAPRASIVGTASLEVKGAKKREIEHIDVHRVKRTLSDCSTIMLGDVNSDCNFDSGDVLFSILYLSHQLVNFSLTEGKKALNCATNQLDQTQDSKIAVDDVYYLFRALIEYTPLINKVTLTPVQSVLSDCLFTVDIELDNLLQNNIALYADIALSEQFDSSTNYSIQDDFESSSIIQGNLITYNKGDGLYGGLIRTEKQTNTSNYTIQLNVTLFEVEIGVSVIIQTYDTRGQTNYARTVALFGSSPYLYPGNLMVNVSGLLISSSGGGYSPLYTVNNLLDSSQCSDLPLIDSSINVTFISPFVANITWMLDNKRIGLDLTEFIFVEVSNCPVDQMTIISDTCYVQSDVSALTSTTASVMTLPFTAYQFRVNSPSSRSDSMTVISPEYGRLSCNKCFMTCFYLVPNDLLSPSFEFEQMFLVLKWSLPLRPNGIITHYRVYLNNSTIYNGSALSHR